jgi:predicted esterase
MNIGGMRQRRFGPRGGTFMKSSLLFLVGAVALLAPRGGIRADDKQLIAIAKDVGKTYKLQPKLFVAAFSDGSQYAHRFMLKHPQLVVGCAAHSGGTWETGGVNPAGKAIPFVMSCGEKDPGKSFPKATYGRLEWARLEKRRKKAEALDLA